MALAAPSEGVDLGSSPRGCIMKEKKLKEYLKTKHLEYHNELKKIDMDDIVFEFVLGQKVGIEEALYFLEHGEDMWSHNDKKKTKQKA